MPSTKLDPNGAWLPAQASPLAFTLIELCVVIAIIALLAGVLLPSLAKAQTKPQGIQCLDNLKQLQLCWLLYAYDSEGKLVKNGILRAADGWVAGWMTLGARETDNTNILNLMTPKGKLWKYNPSLGMFKCPADKSTSKHGDQYYPRVRSFSLNQKMNCDADWWGAPNAQFINYRKLSDITRPPPAKAFTFIHEREDSIDDGCFGVDLVHQGTQMILVSLPASHHNGAGGVAFADGHVEMHVWKDPRTLRSLSKFQLDQTIPSPNNLDVTWLQERASAPVNP